jgi:uroporphyrin-3 C-methyltransferase
MRGQYLGRMVTPFPGVANTGMSSIDTKNLPEPSDGASGAANKKEVSAAQSSRSFLPGLALLISVAAFAAAGWTAWQLVAFQDIPSRVSGDAGKIKDLSRRLDGLVQQSGQQQQFIADLESALENGLGVIPELSLRLTQNEEQLANIPGINARSRANWLVTEALYYLKIANAQATLAGNATVAASALQLADDKLRDAGDPSLTPVRAQLSTELAALKAVPVIDRTGIAFRLQSLAAQAGSWSFRTTAPDNFSPDIQVIDDGAEATDYWDRFVATVKAVFASIVSVKETNAPRLAQLGSAEEALIVEAVKAELQVARLALIGGNTELLMQSLERVNEQIDEYFDTDSTAVAAARVNVAELRALELPGPLPDISGSLALMLSLTDTALDNSGSEGP